MKELKDDEVAQRLFKPACECPLSYDSLRDPVVAGDGRTYEREYIQRWIDECLNAQQPITSPWTREVMCADLREDRRAKEEINYRRSILNRVEKDGMELGKLKEMTGGERYTEDEEIVLAAVLQQGQALQFASKKLRKDSRISLFAVKQDPFALEHVPVKSQTQEIVWAAVSCQGSSLLHAGSIFKSDKKIVVEALLQDGDNLQYASDELRSDPRIVMKAVQNKPLALQFASKTVQDDKDFVLTVVESEGEALMYASDRLKKDFDVVRIALKNSKDIKKVLEMACPSLLSKKKFVMQMVRQNGDILEFLSEDMKQDKLVVSNAMISNPRALKYASHALKNDSQIALRALELDGNVLEFLGKKIKNDLSLVQVAVKQQGLAIAHASPTLRQHKELALCAVRMDGLALQFLASREDQEGIGDKFRGKCKSLHDDEVVVLAAVQNNGMALQFASERLKGERNIVMSAVYENGEAIQFGSKLFMEDRGVFLSAVMTSGDAFLYATETLKCDWDIVLAALHHNIKYIELLSASLRKYEPSVSKSDTQNEKQKLHNLLENKQFILNAVKVNPRVYLFASKQLKCDLEVIQETFNCGGDIIQQCVHEAIQNNGLALQYVPKHLKNDEDTVKMAIAENPLSLEFASDILKQKKDVVILAIQGNHIAIQYASRCLISCKGFVNSVISQGHKILQQVSVQLQGNKEVVLNAVKKDGNALHYASAELQDDYDVVLNAVQQNGLALQWASARLKNMKNLVIAAVTQNGCALQHVPLSLQYDEIVLCKAVQQTGMALEHISDDSIITEDILGKVPRKYWDNEIFVKIAVSKSGQALKFSADRYKNNRNIVLQALAHHSDAYLYASASLQGEEEFISKISAQLRRKHLSEKAFVQRIVRENGKALKYASDELRGDYEIVSTAVNQNGIALEYVADGLKDDKTIVQIAVKNNGAALEFASEGLKNCYEVVKTAVEQFGLALKYASAQLQGNRSVVECAIMQNKAALQWIQSSLQSDSQLVMLALRADLDVMRAAISKNGLEIEHVHGRSEMLKKDADLVRCAAILNVHVLKFAADDLLCDWYFMKDMVKRKPFALEYASESLRQDPDIVTAAVFENGLALQFAHSSMQSDQSVALVAVKNNGLALQYVDYHAKTVGITKAAVLQNGMALEHGTECQRGNMEIFQIAVEKDSDAFHFGSKECQHQYQVLRDEQDTKKKQSDKTQGKRSASGRQSRPQIKKNHKKDEKSVSGHHDERKSDWKEINYILVAVQLDGLLLQLFPAWQNNYDVVRAAVHQNGMALKYASDELKRDSVVFTAAVKSNGLALQYDIADFKTNQQVVKSAVHNSGLALQFACPELKDNKELIRLALKRGLLPEMLPETLTVAWQVNSTNEEIVSLKQIVQENGLLLRFFSPELQNDMNIALAAVRQNGMALKYCSDSLNHDLKIVLSAIETTKDAISIVHQEWKTDLGIESSHDIDEVACTLRDMKEDGQKLANVPAKLRCSRLVCLQAVMCDGLALRFADARVKECFAIVEEAVRTNGLALQYAAESLKRNPVLAMCAVQNQSYAWQHISCTLYGNEEMLSHASPILRSNKSLMQQALKHNGHTFQYFSKSLRTDKQFAQLAVAQFGINLQYVGQELQDDWDVVHEAVQMDGMSLKFASDRLKGQRKLLCLAIQQSPGIQNDLDYWLRAVNQNGLLLELASEKIKGQKEVVKCAVLNNDMALVHADRMLYGDIELLKASSKKLLDDYDFMKYAVAVNGLALQISGDKMKNCKDVVSIAVYQNGLALEFVSEALKQDFDIVHTALKSNGLAFKYAPACFKDSKVLIRTAVFENALAIKHAGNTIIGDLEILKCACESKNGEEFKDDKQIWLRACKSNGYSLDLASPNIKENIDVVNAAMRQNPDSLQFASSNLWGQEIFLSKATDLLKGNKDFMKVAVTQRGLALKYASSKLQGDEEIVLSAVQNCGLALEYASADLQDEEGVVLLAIGNDHSAFNFASARIKSDRGFVLQAAYTNGLVIEHISQDFQSDRDIVQAAVKQNGNALQHVSLDLRDDKETVAHAVGSVAKSLQFASARLRASKEVVTCALMKGLDSLQYASADLTAEYSFMLDAIRINGNALEYASKLLQGDILLLRECCNSTSRPGILVHCALPKSIQNAAACFFEDCIRVCPPLPEDLADFQLFPGKDSSNTEDDYLRSPKDNPSKLHDLNIVQDLREWRVIVNEGQKIPPGLLRDLRAGCFTPEEGERETCDLNASGSLGLYELFQNTWKFGFYEFERPAYPCVLSFMKMIKANNPTIIGACVLDGKLELGTLLAVTDASWTGVIETQQPASKISIVGKVLRIQKNQNDIASCDSLTGDVGIQLEMYNHKLNENDILISLLEREGIEILKKNHKKALLEGRELVKHWKLIMKLIIVLNIPKISNLCTLWYIDLEAESPKVQRTVLKCWKVLTSFDVLDFDEEKSEFSNYSEQRMKNLELHDHDLAIWKVHSDQNGNYRPKKRKQFSIRINGILISEDTDINVTLNLCSQFVTEHGVDLSAEQRQIVICQDSVFVQGRSGTGKTLVMMIKIILEQIRTLARGENPKNILYITKSGRLCEWVGNELNKMTFNLEDKMQEKPSLVPALCKSWNTLCEGLIRDLHLKKSCTGKLISFEYFQSMFWARENPQKPAGYMDPTLVWAEINTCIKGSSPFLTKEQYTSLATTNKSSCSSPSNWKPSSASHGIDLSFDDRCNIYETFLMYQKFKNGQPPYNKRIVCFDEVDVCSKILMKLKSERESCIPKFDMIFVDEAQDFIPFQLKVILQLCDNQDGFVLGGDTCQTIDAGCSFSFRDLQELFVDEKEVESPPCIKFLSENYRSLSGIVNFGNRLVHLLRETSPKCFDEMLDKDGHAQEESFVIPGDPVRMIHVLDSYKNKGPDVQAGVQRGERKLKQAAKNEDLSLGYVEMHNVYKGITKRNFDGEKIDFDPENTFVIVRDSQERSYAKLIFNAVILTPLESKGLETQNVIVLNFFSQDESGLLWNIARRHSDEYSKLNILALKNKQGDTRGILKKERATLHSIAKAIREVKTLYVSVTRAREMCTLIQTSTSYHKCKYLLEYSKEVLVPIDADGDSDIQEILVRTSEQKGSDMLSKAFRLQCVGDELSNKACDIEHESWELYGEALFCYQKANQVLCDSSALYSDTKRIRVSKSLSTKLIVAKANYLRCQAIFKDSHACFREAAHQYLNVQDVLHAAECFEQSGLRLTDQGDCRLSGMCFVLNKQYHRAMGIFLEGGLYFEAALCVEVSGLVSECMKRSCHELQEKYLVFYCTTLLLIQALSEQSHLQIQFLDMAFDLIEILAVFPEIEIILKMLERPPTSKSVLNDFLIRLHDKNSTLARLFNPNASEINDAKIFRKSRRMWFRAMFKALHAIEHDSCFSSELQELPRESQLHKLLRIAWVSCKSTSSVIHCEYEQIFSVALDIWLKVFPASNSLQNLSESTCPGERHILLRFLECFCQFFTDIVLNEPESIKIVEKIFCYDVLGKQLTLWLLLHILKSLQISSSVFFSRSSDMGESNSAQLKSFLRKSCEEFSQDDFLFLKNEVGYQI